MNLYAILKAFVILFIIVDPFGNIPIFLGLTEKLQKDARVKAFNTAIFTAFLILIIFSVGGNYLLSLFNVTLDDFRIAGGLLLFAWAINLLIKGYKTYENEEDVGVVPLGCPLLAGPGAITTSMVSIGLYGFYETLSALILCFTATWLVLYFSKYIYQILGKSGSLILTKIMAILIATIAVSYVGTGIRNIFFK